MDGRLDGKVALVLGASRGIGASVSLRLASEGASLVLGSRSVEKMEADVVSEIKSRHPKCKVIAVSCDVTCEGDVKGIVSKAVDEFGKLSIAVNNAGVGGGARNVADFDESNYDRIFGTNVKAVFMACKYEIKAMRETLDGSVGSIINVGSVLGLSTLSKMEGRAVYAASKAAMEMITKYAAIENAKKVRVNSVNPGVIATDMTSAMADDTMSKTQFIGRKGKPEEIASLVAFLASDEASIITGASHLADGGWALT